MRGSEFDVVPFWPSSALEEPAENEDGHAFDAVVLVVKDR